MRLIFIGFLFYAVGMTHAKRHVAVLGVYAPFPPDLLREFPAHIGRMLSSDDQLVVYDLRKNHAQALDSAGGNAEGWNRQWLNSLHGGTVQQGLAVHCNDMRELLQCRLELVGMGSDLSVTYDTLFFHAEAKSDPTSLPQEWADGFKRMWGGNESSRASAQTTEFSPPLHSAMLIKGTRVLYRDSVRFFPQGTRLIRGERGPVVEMKLGDQRFFLFPKSSYSLPTSRTLVLDSGRLDLVGGNDSSFLLGPSLRAVGKAKLASLSHEGNTTVLRLFRGRLVVFPLLGTKNSFELQDMESFSTRGYAGERNLLSLEEEKRMRRDLEEFMAGALLSQLLAPSAALREKLFYTQNTIRSADPELVDFMGAGVERFGIPSGIPTLEGELWRHEDKNPDAALRDAGCYLCSPFRVGR